MGKVLVVGGGRELVDEHGELVTHFYEGRVWNLGALLTIAADEFAKFGGGVVLLTTAAMAELGLGLVPPTAADAPNALVLSPARARGWNVARLSSWMAFYSDNQAWPRISVACLPWLRSVTGPLWRENIAPGEFARSLAGYHEVLGTRFCATPGVTGLEVLRGRTRLSEEPYWAPKDFYGMGKLPKGTRHAEDDYRAWSTPEAAVAKSGGFEHTYDAVSQYLAAAGSVYLPVGELHYAVGGEFDPRRGGYWQIELPAWNQPLMPHPAGNHHTERAPAVWVTNPTMVLLLELAEQGVVAAPRVLSSWTGSTLRALRSWQEILREALIRSDDDRHGPEIRRALKATYAEAIGLMGREGGRVFRPDWRHTLIAAARTNLFRKMWNIARLEGRYPVRIKVDAVTYASPEFDPVAAAPRGLLLADPDAALELGKFRYSALPPVRVLA